MKSIFCFAFVAVITMMILRVEGRSMPKCPSQCDTSACTPVTCECGTVKDDCQCCDFCAVCPGQACSLVRNEVCSEGYTCVHPAGSDSLYRMQNDGTCVRSEDAPAEQL